MAKPTYKDINLSFIAHPITGDLVTTNDDEAIKQSVKTLILTGFYERAHHPELGCQVNGLLFELDTIATRLVIAETIRSILREHENRIRVINVSVDSDDNHGYNIGIFYKILAYRKDAKTTLFLNRVR